MYQLLEPHESTICITVLITTTSLQFLSCGIKGMRISISCLWDWLTYTCLMQHFFLSDRDLTNRLRTYLRYGSIQRDDSFSLPASPIHGKKVIYLIS